MAISSVSIASATGSNWLKEAQESLAASETPGGMMGALQDARSGSYSLKTFLAKSQNAMYSLAQISQNSQTSAGALAAQMAKTAAQKRQSELAALAAKLNPQQTNYNTPTELDPVIYFGDGTTIDTTRNIMTMASGRQVDTVTGLEYHDPKDIISMANGAYLDTKNNVLTTADGTKIDSITGLKITV
jgi:hypothetical protein